MQRILGVTRVARANYRLVVGGDRPKPSGARRSDVILMVMRETLALAALGVLIGAGVAIALSRYVSSLVFGLAPRDPATIAAAATIVILMSTMAGYLPARRAARVEPTSALRTE